MYHLHLFSSFHEERVDHSAFGTYKRVGYKRWFLFLWTCVFFYLFSFSIILFSFLLLCWLHFPSISLIVIIENVEDSWVFSFCLVCFVCVFFLLPFSTKFKIDVVSHQHQLHCWLELSQIYNIACKVFPCFGDSFFQALHIHSRVLYRDEIILPGIVQVFRDILQEIKYILA